MSLSDVPGGGHHLDLILSGALRIPIEEAERRKRAGGRDLASILRPGVERIANSIGKQIGARNGRDRASRRRRRARPRRPGRSSADISGLPTVGYPHSELVTPFGIAMS